MRFFSPAKINLFLRVLKKREDGYHDLASLFQAISLGDYLTFTRAETDLLTCTDPSLSCDRSNLIWKAVDLFFRKTGLSFPLHIHLEKRIPVQSGLGGGSSNAATTLWALNQISGLKITVQELSNWSAEIGSDIPFFFSHGTAYCRGRGEVVDDLPPLHFSLPFCIVKPQEGLATPLIFQHLKLEECSAQDPEKLLASWQSNHPIASNDLEIPSFRLLPSLQNLKQTLLSQGCYPVTMTGSGTAFVCFGPLPQTSYPIYPVRFAKRTPNSWYQ